MEPPPGLVASAADHRLQTVALLAAAFVMSAAAAALLWSSLGARMGRERWMRPNYRGQPIVAVSGLVIIVASAVTMIAATAALYDLRRSEVEWRLVKGGLDFGLRSPSAAVAMQGAAALVLLVGFGLLGYRDDTSGIAAGGASAASGFRGHLQHSLQRRRPTTGLEKAFGGLVLALVAVQMATWGDASGFVDWVTSGLGGWRDGGESLIDVLLGDAESTWSVMALLRGAIVVALGANLLNLLDRAPGRATKAALAWWIAALVPAGLVAADGVEIHGPGLEAEHWAIWAAAAVGAAFGLLRSEMAELHMQGDTGANPLGALLGMATVAACPATVEWVVLGLLAALNVASERWSFSRIIDAVRPLRWLDRLGSPYRDY